MFRAGLFNERLDPLGYGGGLFVRRLDEIMGHDRHACVVCAVEAFMQDDVSLIGGRGPAREFDRLFELQFAAVAGAAVQVDLIKSI